MPAHTAPYKSDSEHDPGPSQRLEMCRLACLCPYPGYAPVGGAVAEVSGVSVCALEIERGGVSYTVDTLTALHASHPEAELTLIMGADVASTLHSWREPAQLLALARVAVARRPGAPLPPLADGARVSSLEMPALDVSSSMVRERVAHGQPIEELVGAGVARYIAEHRLYRVASRTGA